MPNKGYGIRLDILGILVREAGLPAMVCSKKKFVAWNKVAEEYNRRVGGLYIAAKTLQRKWAIERHKKNGFKVLKTDSTMMDADSRANRKPTHLHTLDSPESLDVICLKELAEYEDSRRGSNSHDEEDGSQGDDQGRQPEPSDMGPGEESHSIFDRIPADDAILGGSISRPEVAAETLRAIREALKVLKRKKSADASLLPAWEECKNFRAGEEGRRHPPGLGGPASSWAYSPNSLYENGSSCHIPGPGKLSGVDRGSWQASEACNRPSDVKRLLFDMVMEEWQSKRKVWEAEMEAATLDLEAARFRRDAALAERDKMRHERDLAKAKRAGLP